MHVKQSLLDAIKVAREFCSLHPGEKVYVMDKVGKDAVAVWVEDDYQSRLKDGWAVFVTFCKKA